MLTKFTEQYLPDIPKIDLSTININTVIKNIRTFYSAKGTPKSIAYLFKILYGEDVSVSYPKEQIVKPSAATWQVDTILRCVIVEGDANNLADGLIQQFPDNVDPSIGTASALIENFISIKTSELEIFEFALNDYWSKQNNQIVTFEKLMYDFGSPGKVFQLDEKSMESYLEKLENEGKNFVFNRGAGGLRQISKIKQISEIQLLKNCYKKVA